MSMVDHHPLIIGLALFGLAYLNGRMTFPISNDRTAGPIRTTSLPFSDRQPR